jgi:hypothetical protein
MLIVSPVTMAWLVVDVGDGLRILRVAVYILNKQSLRADRGAPEVWAMWGGGEISPP